jgi:hypothetical protein
MHNQRRRGHRPQAQALRRADLRGAWARAALALLLMVAVLVLLRTELSPWSRREPGAGPAAGVEATELGAATSPTRSMPGAVGVSPVPGVAAVPPTESRLVPAAGSPSSSPSLTPTGAASPRATPTAAPASVEAGAQGCDFGVGFAELVAALGEETVGRCTGDEYVNLTSGDTHQRTTRGLLVWRRPSIAAFTDGATTWRLCSQTLVSQPSQEPPPC